MKSFGLVVLALGFLAAAEGCKRRSKSAGSGDEVKGGAAPNTAQKRRNFAKRDKGTFTVGKTTTFVTGPLDADGRVDYAFALNERLSKSVTPENNANVLIWKAVGPHPEGVTMPDGFFKLLGVSAPPERGDYFIPLRTYARDHLKSSPEAVNNTFEKLGPLVRRTWTAAENPDIDGWLKANEKPLGLVLEATRRTHFYSPLVPPRTDKGPASLLETRLPVAQLSREIAAALAIRAMLRTAGGEADAAWQDLIACHKLGRLVARGGTLIEALVGCAIEQFVYQSDLVFLDRTGPDSNRIESYLRDLRTLPPVQDVAAIVDRTDRFTHLDIIMFIDRNGLAAVQELGGGGNAIALGDGAMIEFMLDGIDWDPALKTANDWFDRIVAILKEPHRPDRSHKLEKFGADFRTFKRTACDETRLAQLLKDGIEPGKAKGQAIGDVLITLLMPATDKVQDAVDRAVQAQENLTLAFALAWYHRANDKYPDSLAALAPNYLKEVPRDLFSEKPLIYHPAPNGYVLYSVGVNGRDDGGRGYEDQPRGDDLVVRMPSAR